jgi:hypothetical protein
MNRYLIICRLRWPALLLLTGVIALLDQANILSWGRAWPLYLILWGVLALAERATLASNPPPDYSYTPGYQAGYQAAGYAPQPGTYQQVYPQGTGPTPGATSAPEAASTEIVPAHGSVESLSKEPRKSWEEEER